MRLNWCVKFYLKSVFFIGEQKNIFLWALHIDVVITQVLALIVSNISHTNLCVDIERYRIVHIPLESHGWSTILFSRGEHYYIRNENLLRVLKPAQCFDDTSY
jgi:hypothetical protein